MAPAGVTQDIVHVDSSSKAGSSHVTPNSTAVTRGGCDTDGFDMQACLNRGRPMLVEWDGREREFIDAFGLCSPTRWPPASRGSGAQKG